MMEPVSVEPVFHIDWVIPGQVLTMMLLDPLSEKGLAAMSMAVLRPGFGRCYGAMAKDQVSDDLKYQVFLPRFESECRMAGITRLRGHVSRHLWERSYREHSGFHDTGEVVVVGKRTLMVIEKEIGL